MQDQQPTSHPDADAEAGTPLDGSAPVSADMPLEAPAFDPDAFEEAAAQFRPSWDDADRELSSDVIAAEITGFKAPEPVLSEPGFVRRGTGEIDVVPPEVVVPRPPRTPQLDYSGMRTQAGEDLEVALPQKSMRSVWISAAVFTGAAVLAFALMRGGDSDEGKPEPVRVEAPAEAPARVVEPSVPPATPPTTAEAIPTPPPPAEVAPAVVAPPQPVVTAPKPAVTAPKKEAVSSRSSARTRTERTARASKIRKPAVETRTSTSSTSTSNTKRAKRGAGFVSANPY